MILEVGEKLFVITRRKFEGDLRRHFVGDVESVTDTAARVRGYAFVYDESSNSFVRRPDLRTRIMAIADPGNIVVVLPPDVAIAQLRYEFDESGQRILTDGTAFRMNVNEFGSRM